MAYLQSEMSNWDPKDQAPNAAPQAEAAPTADASGETATPTEAPRGAETPPLSPRARETESEARRIAPELDSLIDTQEAIEEIDDQDAKDKLGEALYREIVARAESMGKKKEAMEQVAELLKNTDKIFPAETRQAFAELEQTKEDDAQAWSRIMERKREINASLCEPLIQGHLNAADVLALIPNGIKIDKAGTTAMEASQAQGYEGKIHYDFDKGSIIIPAETLKDQPAGVPAGERFNWKQLMNHEISHPLVDRVLIDQKDSELIEEMKSAEAAESKNPLIAEARKILDAAEKIADSQPQHIRNVLKAYLENKARIESGQDEDKDAQLAKLRLSYAIEIITDYTAIFLRSDGTPASFFQKCLDTADKSALAGYLAKAIGQETTSTEAIYRLQTISQKLAAEGNNPDFIQKLESAAPGVTELFRIYETFYKAIKEKFGENAEKIKGKVSEFNLRERDLGYEDDEFYDGGGYYDAPLGTTPDNKGKTGNSKEDGVIAAAKNLMTTYADNILGAVGIS
jgi:hypothetical protein